MKNPFSIIRRTLHAAPALVVVAATAVALTGCISEDEHASVIKERDELRKALDKVESENRKAVDRMLQDLEEGASQRAELEKKLIEAQQVVDQAMSEVEKIREEFDAYREQYKVSAREKAAGRELGDLVTQDEKSYRSVVIKEVNPAGILIVHSSGVSRIAYQQLPDALQDELLFDAEEAIAFIRAEKEAEADYQRQLAELEKVHKERLAAAQESGESREGMKLVGGKHIQVWVKDDGGSEAGDDKSAPADSTYSSDYAALLRNVENWRIEAQELREKIKVLEYRQWLANIYGKSASHTKNLKELQARLDQLNKSIEQGNLALDRLRG